jgi:hypothetical protein
MGHYANEMDESENEELADSIAVDEAERKGFEAWKKDIQAKRSVKLQYDRHYWIRARGEGHAIIGLWVKSSMSNVGNEFLIIGSHEGISWKRVVELFSHIKVPK